MAAVYYVCVFENNQSQFGFVIDKSKLAPNHGHTIPSLELCTALLATDIVAFIQEQLKFLLIELSSIQTVQSGIYT